MRRFLRNWTAEEPHYNRWSRPWWQHYAVVFTVFGITGSSAMWLVRPHLNSIMFGDIPKSQLTSMQSVASLVAMMPFYYAILFVVGTAFGKQAYVKAMVMRPFTRLRRGRGGQTGQTETKQ